MFIRSVLWYRPVVYIQAHKHVLRFTLSVQSWASSTTNYTSKSSQHASSTAQEV